MLVVGFTAETAVLLSSRTTPDAIGCYWSLAAPAVYDSGDDAG
ncbi:MAG: hypothetical protein WC340_11090 [Kiritimatiellia bacterium]